MKRIVEEREAELKRIVEEREAELKRIVEEKKAALKYIVDDAATWVNNVHVSMNYKATFDEPKEEDCDNEVSDHEDNASSEHDPDDDYLPSDNEQTNGAELVTSRVRLSTNRVELPTNVYTFTKEGRKNEDRVQMEVGILVKKFNSYNRLHQHLVKYKGKEYTTLSRAAQVMKDVVNTNGFEKMYVVVDGKMTSLGLVRDQLVNTKRKLPSGEYYPWKTSPLDQYKEMKKRKI